MPDQGKADGRLEYYGLGRKPYPGWPLRSDSYFAGSQKPRRAVSLSSHPTCANLFSALPIGRWDIGAWMEAYLSLLEDMRSPWKLAASDFYIACALTGVRPAEWPAIRMLGSTVELPLGEAFEPNGHSIELVWTSSLAGWNPEQIQVVNRHMQRVQLYVRLGRFQLLLWRCARLLRAAKDRACFNPPEFSTVHEWYRSPFFYGLSIPVFSDPTPSPLEEMKTRQTRRRHAQLPLF